MAPECSAEQSKSIASSDDLTIITGGGEELMRVLWAGDPGMTIAQQDEYMCQIAIQIVQAGNRLTDRLGVRPQKVLTAKAGT